MSEQLGRYLETLSRTQQELSSGFRALRRDHPREPDLSGVCERLAAQCLDHAEQLEPFLWRYRALTGRDPCLGRARSGEPGSGACGVKPPGLEAALLEPPGAGSEGFGAESFGAEGFGGEGLGADGLRADGLGADGLGARGFGAGGFDAGGFGAGGLDAGGYDTARFDAAGLGAVADLPRVIRGAADGERTGAEGGGSGTVRRPSVTPRGRGGGLTLLRDLHELYLLATGCDLSWTVIAQAARGLRDDELLGLTRRCAPETAVQLLWLRTRMCQAAPQVLVVPSREFP